MVAAFDLRPAPRARVTLVDLVDAVLDLQIDDPRAVRAQALVDDLGPDDGPPSPKRIRELARVLLDLAQDHEEALAVARGAALIALAPAPKRKRRPRPNLGSARFAAILASMNKAQRT